MSYRLSIPVTAAAFALLSASLALPNSAQAQREITEYQYMFLQQPRPAEGLPVSPFFEGWYDNGDGTYTLSFGYLNRNDSSVVHIPHGENNLIDASDFQGVQPTVFQPGRNRGVYAVTVPADNAQAVQDVWWNLTNEGEVHSVPGRASSGSYELDWRPRPHGSLPPLMWFSVRDAAERGPGGRMAPEPLETTVGQPLTLSVNVYDDSEHDETDERFADGIPVRVVWSLFQGDPEGYRFTRHLSNPAGDRSDGPETIRLPEGEGSAQVGVVFSEPGEYLFRAQSDNWAARDSSSNDQCCWSNGYQRVIVSE